MNVRREKTSFTFSSSFSPLSLMKTFSSSWLMPSMLLGTLEMEGFGTVMLDRGIWVDFDMEIYYNTQTVVHHLERLKFLFIKF